MANRYSFSFALLSCLVLTCSSASADVIEATNLFANTELSDANTQVSNTITITDTGIIKSLSVTINNLEHTAAGDLIAELRFLGPGGPSGPGGEPAYLFFRPNVDDIDVNGSLSNLNGDYTFSDDPNGANFWTESAIPDDETVPDNLTYFASGENAEFNDLGGVGGGFFGGFDVAGDWQLIVTDANTGITENNDGTVGGWTIEFHVEPIPEPTTGAIVALVAGFAAMRRRRG